MPLSILIADDHAIVRVGPTTNAFFREPISSSKGKHHRGRSPLFDCSEQVRRHPLGRSDGGW